MNGLKIFATFLLLLTASFLSWAQEQEYDNTFGGWNFIEVNHDFKKHSIYLTGYIECDNYQFQRLECVYGRFSVGYMPLKWLKFGLNYVPLYEPDRWKHYIEADLVGTLKSGDFKVSIRERYRYCFNTQSNELRSRLKVAYTIPSTKLTPYLAMEVFTWTEWKKTRHYVACAYDITKFMQIEGYYLYYTFAGMPAEHVLGLGLNFDF